eukprot:UN27113
MFLYLKRINYNKQSLELYEEMLSSLIRPNNVHYTILAKSFHQLGKLEKLLEGIVNLKIEPDSMLVAELIGTCKHKIPDTELALKFYNLYKDRVKKSQTTDNSHNEESLHITNFIALHLISVFRKSKDINRLKEIFLWSRMMFRQNY